MAELIFGNQTIQVRFGSDARALLATIPGLLAAAIEEHVGEAVTPFALTLLDDTDAAAMRATLGLGASATLSPSAVLANLADPESVVLVDDFIGGNNESGELGNLNWTVTTGTGASLGNEANHPGVSSLWTTTTASQVVSFHLGSNNANTLLRSADVSELIWIVRENTADNLVDIRIGIFGALDVNPPVNWIGVEKLSTDTNWHLVARAAGTQTRIDTGVSGGTASWRNFKFRRVSAADWRVSVNGAAEVSVTTNIPSVDAQPGIQMIPTTTAQRILRIDFFSLRLTAMVR